MSLGGDDVRPFTPVAAVASQFVLGAKRGDDPGDAARVLMYPGELARGLWQRAVCATSILSLRPVRQALASPWKDSVDTDELKTYFRRVSKVFGSKITHVIAGSFFSVGAALLALVRGDTATLGLFSCVMIGYPIMTTRAPGAAAVGARAFLSAGVHDHEYNVSETGGRGEEEGEAQGEGGESAFSYDHGRRRSPE